MTDLYSPLALGQIELKNRILMAPMTRSRAEPLTDEANDLMTEYYRQRAGAGLIITEGIHPSPEGKGYCRTPGLYNPQQAQRWKQITDAVHAEDGKIVAQLMHVGRISHPENKAAGAATLAPSAIQAKGDIYTDSHGMQPMVTPKAMSEDEIRQVINDYRNSARLALQAGFDGVELHATSGYLPAQFMATGSNQRTDQYGGNAENRVRFVVELLEALCDVMGSGRVGLRICPGNPFNDIQDDNPEATHRTLLQAIKPLNLAYLHVIRMDAGVDNVALAHECFNGPLILNDNYKQQEAEQAIVRGFADAISFGRAFISNPDLVSRMQNGAPLNRFDTATLYTPGAKGYTDYPCLRETEAESES